MGQGILTAEQEDKQTNQACSGLLHGAFFINEGAKTGSKQRPELLRVRTSRSSWDKNKVTDHLWEGEQEQASSTKLFFC